MWCTLCCPKEQTQYNNESIQDNEKQIIIGNTKLNHVTIETCIQFIKFVCPSSKLYVATDLTVLIAPKFIFNLSYLLSFSVSRYMIQLL